MNKNLPSIKHPLEAWHPSYVFYNTETEFLYKNTYDFEEITSMPGHKGTEYCVELDDLLPDLKNQRVLIAQIKGMMRESLGAYINDIS